MASGRDLIADEEYLHRLMVNKIVAVYEGNDDIYNSKHNEYEKYCATHGAEWLNMALDERDRADDMKELIQELYDELEITQSILKEKKLSHISDMDIVYRAKEVLGDG